MPDWAMQLLLAVIGSASITGGIGWYFKTRREDRIRREATQQTIVDKLEARNEALRTKIESLLADAFARERENNAQQAERITTDKQMVAIATAMTAALDRAEAINARLLKDGR